MLHYRQIHEASWDQLRRWWEGLDALPPSFEEDGFEEVAFALTQHGPDGTRCLRESLFDLDRRRRGAAIFFLADAQLDGADLRAAVDAAFADGDSHLAIIAFHACERLAYFPLSVEETARYSEAADERLAACAMVYRSVANPDLAEEILRSALMSTNPRLRESACDAIGDRQMLSLRDLMLPLLHDGHPDVVASARANLDMF